MPSSPPRPPSPARMPAPPLSANQALMSLIVALLILNAAGFLLLSVQFLAPKQSVLVVSTGGINAKLDAIQAKLASFEAQAIVPPAAPTPAPDVAPTATPQGGSVGAP